MKSFINIIPVLAILIIAGCSKNMTDYRDFLDNKEIVYPGVVSKLKVDPGNYRALLTWSPSPDPAIKKYIVYWNDRTDSLVVDAVDHDPLKTVNCIINGLGEYVYTFSLVSVDDKGNRSIESKTKSVKIYGDLYAAGLINRPFNVSNPSVFNGEIVTLNFTEPDTINVNTEIRYTALDGKEKTVNLAANQNSITLPDYKVGQPILYKSTYMPITGAVDTFSTSKYDRFPVTKNVTSNFLKNAINPIQPLETDIGDRFRTPRDWIVNDAVKTWNGNSAFGTKMGGWGADQGGSFLVTVESPQTEIVNGKIYQTVRLPAGNYTLKTDEAAFNGGSTPNLLIAVEGNTLPDLNGNVPAGPTLGYADIGRREMSFVLTQETTVSIGFLVTVTSGHYWILRSVSLLAVY
jgi:hypothetical protein